MRHILVAAIASAAAAAVAGGTASGSVLRGDDCEAVARPGAGQVNCVGTLPTSRARVVLKSRNGSGERGVALVKLGLHETTVEITLKGAPAGVGQPAHIRKGGCGGTILASLGNVVDGTRRAMVRPLDHTTGFAVAVRASTERGAPVVACGIVAKHAKG